jgi:hypothetical protein
MSSDGEWPSPGGSPESPQSPESAGVGRYVVGGFVGLAGLLLLAEPVVDPLAVGDARIPMFGLAGVALAIGLDLGAVVFYRAGQRTVAMAHGVAGLGWTFLAVGPMLGSGTLLVVGLVVVIGGVLFLAAESRKWV